MKFKVGQNYNTSPVGQVGAQIGMYPGYDQGPPPEQEDQIINVIQQKIMKEFPHLLDYAVNIRTVDKKDESLSYVFAVDLKTPTGEFVLPVFVVNGVIKPMNILYDKIHDIYIPNTKAWLEFSDSALFSGVGQSVKTPKDLKTDVDVRNLVIPPTTGRYSYASDPDEVVLLKINSLPETKKKSLVNFFRKNREILAKCANLYGKEALKVAFSSIPKEKSVNKDNPTFEVVDNLEEAAKKKNKFFFNSIVGKGYAIKDKRDKESLNKSIIVKEPEYYFQINSPGLYRVWTTEGIKDVLVGIKVENSSVYENRLSNVLPASVSDYRRGGELNLGNVMLPTGKTSPLKKNYFILTEDGKLMIPDSYIRETYTALKILNPNRVKGEIFNKIFDNIHESNIYDISVKDSNLGKQNDVLRPRGPKEILDNYVAFISVKANGSISGIVLNGNAIDNVIKKDDSVIISVTDFDNNKLNKLIYDPDLSGQDFMIKTNGHEVFVILPYNTKFIKAKKADFDILDASGINNHYKAFIERLGGRRVINVSNQGDLGGTKKANEIIEIAEDLNIPVYEAELIKAASTEYPLVDVFILTTESFNVLDKLAEALDFADSNTTNFILSLPYYMSKIGQAMGQAMTGTLPPYAKPVSHPALVPPEAFPPGMPPGMPGMPGPEMGAGAPDSGQTIIDKYIEDTTNKVKELNTKINELKNVLSILADIKQQSGQPPANMEQITNLLRDSADMSNEAFDASMILGLTDEPDFEKNIMTYLPVILNGIDSIGRIIVSLHMQSAQVANKYGEKYKNSIEDKANRILKQLGDFYMFIKGAKITDGQSKP